MERHGVRLSFYVEAVSLGRLHNNIYFISPFFQANRRSLLDEIITFLYNLQSFYIPP